MDWCIGSGIHGIIDSLIAANYTLLKSGHDPMFSWDTVSIEGESITPTNGLKIEPDYSLDAYLRLETSPDVWIFPAVFQSSSGFGKVQKALEDARLLLPEIRQHHAQGKLLISICSGSFLLAAAGLLGNHPALMHWKSEHHFRRLFPNLRIDTRHAVADYGDIICAIGGGMACEYLVMHLVERFAGHRTAVDTAKLLMMHLNGPSPLPFRTSIEASHHSDDLVRRAQRYLEQHSSEEIDISGLAREIHISDRQLNRRFTKALACSPIQYLQQVRINRACSLLELTTLPSSKIVFEVGYRDESSFRRLFKKQMAMTMEGYRQQFGVTTSATQFHLNPPVQA
jgi:transcriptional regulator GlxA family with amidase domain